MSRNSRHFPDIYLYLIYILLIIIDCILPLFDYSLTPNITLIMNIMNLMHCMPAFKLLGLPIITSFICPFFFRYLSLFFKVVVVVVELDHECDVIIHSYFHQLFTENWLTSSTGKTAFLLLLMLISFLSYQLTAKNVWLKKSYLNSLFFLCCGKAAKKIINNRSNNRKTSKKSPELLATEE